MKKALLCLLFISLSATTSWAQVDTTAAQVADKAAREAATASAQVSTATAPDSLAPATPKAWTIKGMTGLNLSQTSLTNWAAGGENTVAGNVYFNAVANYAQNRWIWDNALNTEFGLTYTQSNKWQKSVDKLEVTSKPGYAINKWLFASAMVNFLTQYTIGYEKPGDNLIGKDYISNFMAPGYLNASVGIEYKPNTHVSVYFSPFTSKTTFVLDNLLSSKGAYGVAPGKRVFAELGTSLVANAAYELTKGLSLISKLTLFTAYTHNFGTIDVNWDMMLAYKLNDYFTATLTTNLIYDDDIRPNPAEPAKVQFKEMLGIGIGYAF